MLLGCNLGVAWLLWCCVLLRCCVGAAWVPRHAMPRHGKPCYAKLCQAMPCHAARATVALACKPHAGALHARTENRAARA
eukprot:3832303-Lingulodinium_polyedra.AAC.1